MSDLLVPLGFGIAASLTTLLGGMLALKLAERTSLILAVAAGIVLGVAFLDLLPEALEFGAGNHSARATLAYAAAGFGGYLLLGRMLASAEGDTRWQAHLGPASLTLHSLLDGLVMGVAFQIAPEIGGVVALAVLTHDLADGVNTVSLALSASRQRIAFYWLLVNGAAPLAGVLIGLVLRVDHRSMAPLMAVFGGVFLYIGACELVPRSLARDGRLRTTLAVLAGIAAMLAITALAE